MKIKSLVEFKNSLSLEEPPDGLSVYEKSLWHSAKDEWEKAHNIVQDLNDKSSALVHAFLHRQEGDLSNAKYWYDRAGSHMPSISLDEEWEELVTKFLAD
jgi:hypothetical protein